jgi:hypothetical protein
MVKLLTAEVPEKVLTWDEAIALTDQVLERDDSSYQNLNVGRVVSSLIAEVSAEDWILGIANGITGITATLDDEVFDGLMLALLKHIHHGRIATAVARVKGDGTAN